MENFLLFNVANGWLSIKNYISLDTSFQPPIDILSPE